MNRCEQSHEKVNIRKQNTFSLNYKRDKKRIYSELKRNGELAK